MKNKKAVILLFSANAISGFAQGLSMLAIPWYFTQQDKADTFTFYYGLVTFLILFWGFFAGALVDRYSRKAVFLATNAIEMSALLGVAALGFYLGSLPDFIVIFVFLLTILGFHIHYPNLYAFAQVIVPVEDIRRINTYIEIVGQATMIGSGLLSTLFLEGADFQNILGTSLSISFPKLTIYEIFLIDGLTYVVSVTLISFISYEPYRERNPESGAVFKRIRTGLQYVRSNSAIYFFGVSAHAVFVTVLVLIYALVPIYIDKNLKAGGEVFGFLDMVFASGALCAGFVIRRILSRVKLTNAVLVMSSVVVTVLVILAFTKSTVLTVSLALIVGFCNSGTRVARVTYLLERLPTDIVGRFNSMLSMTGVIVRASFLFVFSLSFFSEDDNICYALLIQAGYLIAMISLMLIMKRRFDSVERISYDKKQK